jgi:hypothetical protein
MALTGALELISPRPDLRREPLQRVLALPSASLTESRFRSAETENAVKSARHVMRRANEASDCVEKNIQPF